MKKYLLIAAGHLCLLLSSATLWAQKPDNSIKIMTYNILHGAAPGLRNTANNIDLSAVAKVIKAQDPDIIALQEVDSMALRSKRKHQTQLLAEKTGMHYYFFSDSRSFTDTAGWGYGVAILSKHKLSQQQTVSLPHNNHPGSENWVNAAVTVTFPNGKSLRFICAHFDYLNKDNRLLEAQATNKAAMASLIPVILAGDLNARPNSAAIKELEKAFTRSCENCALTFSSDRPRVKLDYIMYSKNSAFKLKSTQVLDNEDTRFASDHLPYITILAWK